MATFKTGWIKKMINNVSTRIFAISHVKSTYYDYASGTTLDEVLIETEDSDQEAPEENEISPAILSKLNETRTEVDALKEDVDTLAKKDDLDKIQNTIGDVDFASVIGCTTLSDAVANNKSPRNFSNLNLNTINIDEVYNYNYVTAISINDGTYGTLPTNYGDNWWNVVNFFSYHFVTQIAFLINSNRIFIRTRWISEGLGWNEWGIAQQEQIDTINNIIGDTNLSGYGTISNFIDKINNYGVSPITFHRLEANTSGSINLPMNRVYFILLMPWTSDVGAQKLFMLSTFSTFSLQRLDNGEENTQMLIESLGNTDVDYFGIKITNNTNFHLRVQITQMSCCYGEYNGELWY